jgi:hypothetical protein
MAHDSETTGIDGHFFRLVATFEAAAMQQLGKIAHPVTGDIEVNLDGARDSIEMLDMVRRKTDGNLNGDEGRLLDHVLYQLRMNYVDVAREGGEPESANDSKAEDSPTDSEPPGAQRAAAGGSDAKESGPVDSGEGVAA